jgi:histidine phosphotransferase ChpT
MPLTAPLRVVELLAARLCHDLISPVAAIANGAELLGEDDPEFVREAVALVGTSAREANARLQFFRFAYGFGGSGLAGPAPCQLAAAYFAETPIVCDYGEAARALPLERQKLACTMLIIAREALPRGGRLIVRAASGGPEIEATGAPILLSAETRAALTGAAGPAELTTRTVPACFAGLLAAAQGRRLVVRDRADGFLLSAPPP